MPERLYFGNRREPIRRAILHCAATPTNWAKGKTVHEIVEEIRRWHKQRGFNDIGYHYVVDPNGFIARGRSLRQIGAHTLGENADSLGILMVETNKVGKVAEFRDYFTLHQQIAVTEILRHHDIRQVNGHNDYAPTLCPGFKVRGEDFLPKPVAGTWQALGGVLKSITPVLSEKRKD